MCFFGQPELYLFFFVFLCVCKIKLHRNLESSQLLYHVFSRRSPTQNNKTKMKFQFSPQLFIYLCADFPGAKVVSEAVAKSGTTPLSPAITFILDKVAPFIPEEPKAEPAAAEATSREVAVEEKKEEAEPAAAAATEEAAPAPAETPSEPAAEEKKEEEKPAAEEAAPPAAAPEEK
jgi:hypothetical protein